MTSQHDVSSSMNQTQLRDLVQRLRNSPGVRSKLDIQGPAQQLKHAPRAPQHQQSSSRQASSLALAGQGIALGDDAAAIADGSGFLLFAAEGLHPEFVSAEPWFAGFCSVMVNVSDIVAMGGRPIAVVDVLFSSQSVDDERILEGMRDASEAFDVPIVGGHTGRSSTTALAVAIIGRAKRVLSSFHARPGHQLLYAVDRRGAYRTYGNHFNAATCASHSQLQSVISILPALAEAGLVEACKDVSMAGLAGTLAMLCESSGVGASLDLGALDPPSGADLERWLLTFPSFGYILAVRPDCAGAVCEAFEARGVSCGRVGEFHADPEVRLQHRGVVEMFWDLSKAMTGFGQRELTASTQPARATHPLVSTAKPHQQVRAS